MTTIPLPRRFRALEQGLQEMFVAMGDADLAAADEERTTSVALGYARLLQERGLVDGCVVEVRNGFVHMRWQVRFEEIRLYWPVSMMTPAYAAAAFVHGS